MLLRDNSGHQSSKIGLGTMLVGKKPSVSIHKAIPTLPGDPAQLTPLEHLCHRSSCTEVHSAIPSDVDLLITHTPPHKLGRLDAIHDGTPVGCEELTRRLTAPASSPDALQPLLHVFGHIHEARGVHLLKHGEDEGAKETVLVNAALVEYDQDKWNKHRICKSRWN